MDRKIAISAFVTIVGLAKIREFYVQFFNQIFGFHLPRSKVKLHSLEDLSFIII